MKIRELMQTEIWSKKTTWKICIAVVAFIGLWPVSWYSFERFYLSPRERNAARDALAEIDRLQESGSLTDDAFAAKAKTAEAKIRNADRVEWTERDIGVNFLLSNYLGLIQTERILARKQRDSGTLQVDPTKQTEYWQSRLKKSEAEHKSRLHKLLD
jgi:hypothetical protein